MSISSQTKRSIIEQLIWCEHRISELEDQLAEAREEHVRVTGELLTHREECLRLLEKCVPAVSQKFTTELHTEIRTWLEVVRGKGWTENEESVLGEESE